MENHGKHVNLQKSKHGKHGKHGIFHYITFNNI